MLVTLLWAVARPCYWHMTMGQHGFAISPVNVTGTSVQGACDRTVAVTLKAGQTPD